MARKNDDVRLFVNVGDTVVLNFGKLFKDRPDDVVGLVLSKMERYARINGGKTPMQPALEYSDLETGEVTWVDQAYVVSIQERYKGARPPINIFAKGSRRSRLVWREARGVLAGSLVDLVAHCLASLNQELSRPLDDDKVQALFDKQHPGYLGSDFAGLIYVREKPFRAWVRRNSQRFIASVKTMVEVETRLEQEIEADYKGDFDAMQPGSDDDLGQDDHVDDPDARQMQEENDLLDILHDISFGFAE